MTHERREGTRDDSYNGETYRRSADASQYHPSENEQVQRQPQSAVSIHWWSHIRLALPPLFV
jgi:hypothetical protein